MTKPLVGKKGLATKGYTQAELDAMTPQEATILYHSERKTYVFWDGTKWADLGGSSGYAKIFMNM